MRNEQLIDLKGIKAGVAEARRGSRNPEEDRIIIITGTPGVGKSSVSSLLASKIGAHVISVGKLVEEEDLHLGWDDERKTYIADLDAVSKRISQIMRGRRGTIIIEGHYAVHVVPPEKVSLVLVLRRDPRELKRILENRLYDERKIRENLAAEILDVCLYDAVSICGVEKVLEVDVTGKSPAEAVEEILMLMKRKRSRVGIVDWLGMLESEGELDDYLGDF
ncbi:MAG: adenylate kinase [Candidatus Bathyarchaeota archaeon B63]|nr:MAG: adenylate kinase [Candidatus Bathyarchaeota archaeon B63]